MTRPSDLEVYERRASYEFPPGTQLCDQLPPRETPEAQVASANAWEFFRLVRMHGGQHPHLTWHEPHERPIVILSPVVKLTEGPGFEHGAHWALMHCHAWDDRRRFLDMGGEEVKAYFRAWREQRAAQGRAYSLPPYPAGG